jgi:twinkle protein
MMMFEETVQRTALGLMSISLNKNLTLLNDPEKEDGFRDAYDRSVGSGRCFLYDHFGSTDISNVLDRARYMASALDVRWLFLDHLSILVSGMAEGDERRLIDNAMTSIKTLAMETGMGVILVSHLKRPEKKGHEDGATTSLSQLRGSHAIAQLSDIVVGLERNQQSEDMRDITTLRILKNRWTGETGVAGQLKYDRLSGRLYESTEVFDEF